MLIDHDPIRALEQASVTPPSDSEAAAGHADALATADAAKKVTV
jgi:hypothetical protein